MEADCDHLFLWNIRLDGRDALSIYAGTADRAGHSVRDSRECTDNGYIAAGRAFHVGGLPDDMIKNRTDYDSTEADSFPLFRAVMQEPITMYYL